MIFLKLRRELRGRLGLWAAVSQLRRSLSCGAGMFARHSRRQERETSGWFPQQVSQKNWSSAWSLSEEASSGTARKAARPAGPCVGDSTWPQSSAGSGGNLLQQ